MSKKVSVVMPLYRNKESLPRALDSLLQQDYDGEIEILLMFDDGKDGTREVALNYVNANPGQVKLIEGETRLGLGGARKEALPHITGDYVYSLDADDEMLPGAMKLLVSVLEDSGADMVNASFLTHSKGKDHQNLFKKNARLDKYHALSALFIDAYFRSVLWQKLFKKELLLSRPLAILQGKGVMFEDLSFVASLLLGCRKVVSIDKPIVRYHKDVATSSSTEARHDRTLRHLAAFALTRLVLEKSGDDKAVSSFLAHKMRTKWSIDYDLSRDKKAGANKEYLAEMKSTFKLLFARDPFDASMTALAPLLEGAFL